jgi:hypothetical protein
LTKKKKKTTLDLTTNRYVIAGIFWLQQIPTTLEFGDPSHFGLLFHVAVAFCMMRMLVCSAFVVKLWGVFEGLHLARS